MRYARMRARTYLIESTLRTRAAQSCVRLCAPRIHASRRDCTREKIIVNEMSRSVNPRQSSLSQRFSKSHRAVDGGEVSHFAARSAQSRALVTSVLCNNDRYYFSNRISLPHFSIRGELCLRQLTSLRQHYPMDLIDAD